MKLFFLMYLSDGFLRVEEGRGPSLGYRLVSLYRSLFRILADAGMRSLLLRLAGWCERGGVQED